MAHLQTKVTITMPDDDRILWPRLGELCRVEVDDRDGGNRLRLRAMRLVLIEHDPEGVDEYVFVQQGSNSEPG